MIHLSSGGETLDECGLKFLLAVRLHTFLLTSLPPAHRAPLLCQGTASLQISRECRQGHGFDSQWYACTGKTCASSAMPQLWCVLWIWSSVTQVLLVYRTVHLSLHLGVPLGGGRGAAQHASGAAERRAVVARAQSHGRGLVAQEHQ